MYILETYVGSFINRINIRLTDVFPAKKQWQYTEITYLLLLMVIKMLTLGG